jgi:hypothetical protein
VGHRTQGKRSGTRGIPTLCSLDQFPIDLARLLRLLTNE